MNRHSWDQPELRRNSGKRQCADEPISRQLAHRQRDSIFSRAIGLKAFTLLPITGSGRLCAVARQRWREKRTGHSRKSAGAEKLGRKAVGYTALNDTEASVGQ